MAGIIEIKVCLPAKIGYDDGQCMNLKYATVAERAKTTINIGSILYSFFLVCTNIPAIITKQKHIAVIGVKIGKMPVSHGMTMPIQPKSSRTPNIRIGVIESFDFKCPSAMCFSLLPVILPKPGITKKAERSPCIIHKDIFIFIYVAKIKTYRMNAGTKWQSTVSV